MDNLLIKYMEQRFKESETVKQKHKAGPRPVVTISRQAGCSANDIAQNLVAKINELSKDKKWRVINKEIIEKTAKHLEMDPSKVQHVFKGEKKNMID